MDRPPPEHIVAAGWPAARRWSPSPAARLSMAAHGVGAAALVLQPALWPQTLGLLALNHAVLACGMHPRGTMLGPNLSRLPEGGAEVALTFDDGPDPEVTPRILDLLDAHGAKASFFVIGERAARHPALLRGMLARGHTVENHTHTHPMGFAAWGPWRMRREVAAANRAIADACGAAPRLFRAPMGLRNPLLDPVLAAEGLSLVSWTRRGYDTVTSRPGRVLVRLTRGLAGGDILMLHDAGSSPDRAGRPVVLGVLPPLLDAIAAAGLRAVALGPADRPPAAAAARAMAGGGASRTPA